MRTIFVTLSATFITAVIVAVFIFDSPEFSQSPAESGLGGIGKLEGTFLSLANVANIPKALYKKAVVFFEPSDFNKIQKYVESAEAYLKESQILKADKDRYILIDKISKYKDNLSSALIHTEDIEENERADVLAFMVSTTARHIALWSPLYYYLHTDAKNTLRPVIKMLEEKHIEMLKELAVIDALHAGRPARNASASLAGRLATEDLEYYIEDIRKSAARRNSDFIRFSYEDYLGYREFFDELCDIYPEFFLSFSVNAHILFDDFYAMHEEVDLEYSDKTRAYIQDMRVELRDMHKQAILKLRDTDDTQAYGGLKNTILAIEGELRAHADWRGEMYDIMNDDYYFYEEIKNNWNK